MPAIGDVTIQLTPGNRYETIKGRVIIHTFDKVEQRVTWTSEYDGRYHNWPMGAFIFWCRTFEARMISE